jgi:hypothetical protein
MGQFFFFVKNVLWNFLVRTIVFSKIFKNNNFDPENMKKPPSKVTHNRPLTFFFNTGPAAQIAQQQKSHTPKSPLMQDWVFRLGGGTYLYIPLQYCTKFI